jgi:hypothetical protein
MTAHRDPIRVDLPIASCALDRTGLHAQYARYQRLSAAVTHRERVPEMLTVQFDERLDRDLLEETLAVERECCPFFVFDFNDRELRLAIGVRQAQQSPALDALATAFTRGDRSAATDPVP